MIPNKIYHTDHNGNNFLYLSAEVFLIRDKTTDRYIIDHRSGGTYWEPELLTGTLHPRVFMTHRSAQKFLNIWLKGKWSNNSYTDWESGHTEPDFTYDPVPSRIRENMEIITANLQWSHAR